VRICAARARAPRAPRAVRDTARGYHAAMMPRGHRSQHDARALRAARATARRLKHVMRVAAGASTPLMLRVLRKLCYTRYAMREMQSVAALRAPASRRF